MLKVRLATALPSIVRLQDILRRLSVAVKLNATFAVDRLAPTTGVIGTTSGGTVSTMKLSAETVSLRLFRSSQQETVQLWGPSASVEFAVVLYGVPF